MEKIERQRLAKINRLLKKMPANKQTQLLKHIQDEMLDMESKKVKIEEALSKEGITKGTYLESEKPSDFAGIWKGKEIDAQELRNKAWRRK